MFKLKSVNEVNGFIIFDWLCSMSSVSYSVSDCFTLHAFCVLSYDVRLLCHPLNKRIHPTIYIHPNYNRLCSVLYQLNPPVLLRSNGDGRCPSHHLLNKVGKIFDVKFHLRDRLFYAVLNTNCIVVCFEFNFDFDEFQNYQNNCMFLRACVPVSLCVFSLAFNPMKFNT